MTKKRSYRSSQLISPFGPGAIIEIGDESLILADISHWPKNLEEIKLERLARAAGVWKLKKPPILRKRNEEITPRNALGTTRFPGWMFCPKCRELRRWKKSEGKTNDDGSPVCTNRECKEKVLVPMRFVAACPQGHLQDVPWNIWAHMKGNKYSLCEKPELYFESRPRLGSGLDALLIRCGNPECQASNSLRDLLRPNALPVSCSDKQPWEFKDKELQNCKAPLHVLQRGASNLYYPIVRSALDIPHDEVSVGNPVYELIKDSDDFECLQNAIQRGKPKPIQAYAEEIAEQFDLKVSEVLSAAKGSNQESRQFKIPKDADLRLAEWDILASDDIETRQSKTFHARIAHLDKSCDFGFDKLIKRVVLLDKLREVRAFCGFSRVKPDEESAVLMHNSQSASSWLPATEVYGEGVFLEFNQKAFQQWESSMSDAFCKRLSDIQQRCAKAASTMLPEPTCTFIVLHTLAHLLIRQLSFESGYSSGSLRERVYASDGQAGILIYTADGDSEGSLGGLVQQGEPERLFPAILAALETAGWCSNDPVCSEMETQGVMGLNKAACHSCSLISETSCEYNNLLLDRKFLIGDGESDGIFSAVLLNVDEADNR